MEDLSIIKMNLTHLRRLLESELDPGRRRTIEKLIREAEAGLRGVRAPPNNLFRCGCVK